jgi:hypothetical protein
LYYQTWKEENTISSLVLTIMLGPLLLIYRLRNAGSVINKKVDFVNSIDDLFVMLPLSKMNLLPDACF